MWDDRTGFREGSFLDKFGYELHTEQEQESLKTVPPVVVETPQHTIVSLTSSMSGEDPDLVACRDKLSDASINESSRYPHCVSMLTDKAMLTFYSPLSTSTREQLFMRQKNIQRNTEAINLSLRFLNGIPPSRSGIASLMPGVSYQPFTDFYDSHSLLYSISITPSIEKANVDTPRVCRRPRAMIVEERRLNAQAQNSLKIDQSEEDLSTLQDINDIDVSFLTGMSLQEHMEADQSIETLEKLPNGMPSLEIEVAPSSPYLASGGGFRSEEIKVENGDEEGKHVSESLGQGEEHTLYEYEENVAPFDEMEATMAPSALHEQAYWPSTELGDSTGLLSAMDRMMDCFDPQFKPEKPPLGPFPHSYDEGSFDSSHGDLDWEAAMERDDVEWLFPCCDDSGLDNDFPAFLDDDTVGDASHLDQLHFDETGSVGTVSISSIDRKGGANPSCIHAKAFIGDHTMTTDSDSSLDLSD